jgi:hypothetical protein
MLRRGTLIRSLKVFSEYSAENKLIEDYFRAYLLSILEVSCENEGKKPL